MLAAAFALAAVASIAEIDAGWQQRAELSRAKDHVAAVQAAVAADPESSALQWRLCRALFFLGEYALTDKDAKKATLREARDVGERAVTLAKQDADRLPAHVWASYSWGEWAVLEGKLAAVRQGAAAKIRDHATAALRLDPTYDGAAGDRVLGRLHHQTPSVPLLTGWASKDLAVEHLEQAVERRPESLINRQYLGEALWDIDRKRRAEAKAILEGVVAATPHPAFVVEERKAQADARAFLAKYVAKH